VSRLIFALFTAGSCTLGCCLGGFANVYDEAVLNQALEDPDFHYLVDRVGNPVSQELD